MKLHHIAGINGIAISLAVWLELSQRIDHAALLKLLVAYSLPQVAYAWLSAVAIWKAESKALRETEERLASFKQEP